MNTIDALKSIIDGDESLEQKQSRLREHYVSLLRSFPCIVEFTKVDGTPATMRCTLKAELLPPSDGNSPNKALENPSTIRVWAEDRQGWRSFKVLNVTKFTHIINAESKDE